MKKNARRLLTLSVGLFLVGCATHKWTDVSGEPGYREIVGLEFVTTNDCLLFKHSRQDDHVLLDRPGYGGLPEIKDIPANLPYAYYGQQILGVIPAGSSFKIVRAMRVHSFETEYVIYKASITSSGPFQGMEVDPTSLTDRETVPQFKAEYVNELKAGALNEGKTKP